MKVTIAVAMARAGSCKTSGAGAPETAVAFLPDYAAYIVMHRIFIVIERAVCHYLGHATSGQIGLLDFTPSMLKSALNT